MSPQEVGKRLAEFDETIRIHGARVVLARRDLQTAVDARQRFVDDHTATRVEALVSVSAAPHPTAA